MKKIEIYPDGSIYEGEWKDDLQNGYGTWTFADGSIYVGEWKNGEYHGHGRLTYPDGKKHEGEWKDGVYVGEEKPEGIKEKKPLLLNTSKSNY